MTELHELKDDRWLWRHWRRLSADGDKRRQARISAVELAIWLDGRADPALAERVEAALLADDSLLDAAMAVRAAEAEPAGAAPERLLVRARAAVAPQVRGGSRGGVIDGLKAWGRRLQWAAVAASLVVAAAAGLWIGGGAGDSVLAAQQSSVSIFAVSDGAADALLLDDEG